MERGDCGCTGGGSVLRIHFTGVDLARVRMAGRPDALWETILSFHRLRDRRDARLFGEWRTETRSRLNSETRTLGMLIPSRGYFPDFLTPVEGQYGWDVGLDALRGIRPERMRRELQLLGAGAPMTPRLREFMDMRRQAAAAAHGRTPRVPPGRRGAVLDAYPGPDRGRARRARPGPAGRRRGRTAVLASADAALAGPGTGMRLPRGPRRTAAGARAAAPAVLLLPAVPR